jgi:hypothetical protein
MNLRALGVSMGLVAAAVCGWGCGDDDTSSGPEVGELPEQLSQALCDEVEACFDRRTLDTLFGPAGCEKRLLAQIEDGEFANLRSAIDAGRVRYNATRVPACLKQIKGVACDFATKRALQTAACDEIFMGDAKPGADCGLDAECTGAAFCKLSQQCPGTCTELLAAGKACNEDDECADGLTCDTGRCTTPANEDEPCGGAVAASCRAGLLCIGEDELTGKAGNCRTYDAVFAAGRDQSCDYDTGKLCADGLTCAVQRIQGQTAVLSCEAPVGSGESCKFGAPSPCPDDEYCSANIDVGEIRGSCRPLPTAGEACLTLTGSAPCAPGLVCIAARCDPVARLGQPCASDEGCASKRCVASRCQAAPACEL